MIPELNPPKYEEARITSGPVTPASVFDDDYSTPEQPRSARFFSIVDTDSMGVPVVQEESAENKE